VGVDASYWPAGPLNLQAFAARTATSGAGGDGTAYRLGLDLETDRLGLQAQHIYIDPEATADMGFITREDIRRSNGFGRITVRPPILGLRKIDNFVTGNHITRTDGLLQDWELGVGVNPQWESGENLVLFAATGFTRLDEEFDLEDVIVPAGDYDTWQLGFFGTTSTNRPVVLGANGTLQAVYDGHINTFTGSLTVNPNTHLSVLLSYTHSDVGLPTGAFTADIGSMRLALALSTRLFANALLQYNSLDRRLSANVRLNWIHRPGSDLFLVINEERGSDAALWDLSARGIVVKITYLARI
jgi:hypothetical protein